MEDLTNIPTEVLVAEIRKRSLSQACTGELKISESGKKAEFGLNIMPWPDGKYRILIQCVEDLTDAEQESKSINESQR
jgi:hypothetical protein